MMKVRMKKLLLAMLLMTMASTAAFAEGLTDSSDEVVWGYCDDLVDKSLGSPTEDLKKCAIRIPAEVSARYEGCTISSIDIYLCKDVTGLAPVISTGGSENYSVQPEQNGVEGWNEIKLNNPYTIGSGDLYVGYQFVGTYAAGTSGMWSRNGLFLYDNDMWVDYSSINLGAFLIRVHIKGNDLPMDVAMEADDDVENSQGDAITLNTYVQNLSPEEIETLTLNCYINNELEGSHEVKTKIGKGKFEQVPVTIALPSAPNIYKIKIVNSSL